MRLSGFVEIYGMTFSATVTVAPARDGGATLVNGRWKAQRFVNGKQEYFGYYDTQAEAKEASRLGRNIAREKRLKNRDHAREMATGVTFDTRSRMWRIKMVVAGQRVSMGRYATYGHATLVRDVVARRTGKHVVVADYSMPLFLVSDPVARSYITDRVLPPTPDELAEYQRRVTMLNADVINVT